ncbi:MAG: motility protein A [Bacillota bacterium]|nr:motility protein A [Bacillota bacterium]
MNVQTVGGLIAGTVFIITSILLTGDLRTYFDVSSIMIVVGGTVASTFVSYSRNQLKSIIPMVKKAFKNPKIDYNADIDQIIDLANIARKEGLLSLEGSTFNDPFLQKGVELIIDGTDPELVKDILETDIDYTSSRHQMGQQVFGSMAQFAPAYGMIGTLVGLINMLRLLNDPSKVGPNMGVALITTFYGVILANLLFIPMANKLKAQSADEILQKELYVEGLLSIQNGENPRIIKDKLDAFLSKKLRKSSNNKVRQISADGEEHRYEKKSQSV